ncbi:MAG: THUMP domain-containing protein [Promethearchaeota archaeon]
MNFFLDRDLQIINNPKITNMEPIHCLPQYNLILIRYNEIWLKSMKVKMRMLKTLMKNIKIILKREQITFHKYQLSKDTSRILFFFKNRDIPKASKVLRNIFGIFSFSPATRTSSTIKTISDKSIEIAKKVLKYGNTFALVVRRSGKHDFSSKDIAIEVGKNIIEEFSKIGIYLEVNLSNPDKKIFIEVREEFSYIFTEILKSDWGGLPIESRKKIAAMDIGRLSDLLAGFLLMRRGGVLFPVLFDIIENEALFKKRKANWAIVKQFTPFHTFNILRIRFKKALSLICERVQKTDICGVCRMVRFATIASIVEPQKYSYFEGVRALTDGISFNNSAKCPICVDLYSLSLNGFFSELPIFTPNIGLNSDSEIQCVLRINKNFEKIDYCPITPHNQEFNIERLNQYKDTLDIENIVKDCVNRAESIIIRGS